MERSVFDTLTKPDAESTLLGQLVTTSKNREFTSEGKISVGGEFDVSEQAVRTDDDEIDESLVEKCFDFTEIAPQINLECIYDVEDSKDFENFEGGNKTPFEVLRSKMTQLAENVEIYKRIIKNGTGEQVPQIAAIYIHYNLYTEHNEIPFDSSYLRHKKPLRFQLGVNAFIEGMEMGIHTMKKGEESQFLIDHSLAFGLMGVPPRIPPRATILLEVTLTNFFESALPQYDIELDENCPFEEVYSHASSCKTLGNEYFYNKNMPAAISQYKKADNLLFNCQVQNTGQQIMKDKLRIKLIVNMMVCYNYLKEFSKTCSCVKDALLCMNGETKRNKKFFFHLGIAQMELGDYIKACRSLKFGLRISPHSKEIIDALVKLEEKQKSSYAQERELCRKAIGFNNEKYVPIKEERHTEVPEEGRVSEDFKTLMAEYIADFVRQNNAELELPSGLTFSEIEACELMCDAHNLTMFDKVVDGVRMFYFSK